MATLLQLFIERKKEVRGLPSDLLVADGARVLLDSIAEQEGGYERELVKRAVKLFPMTGYLRPSAVRHARRAWVVAIRRLKGQSNWVMRDTRGEGGL